MKHIPTTRMGLAAMLLGLLLLTLGFLLSWTTHNWFTLLCLALIIGGIALHVFLLKRQSPY